MSTTPLSAGVCPVCAEVMGWVLGGVFILILAASVIGEPEGATRRIRFLKGLAALLFFSCFWFAIGVVFWLIYR